MSRKIKEELMNFSISWKLDGDVIECKNCKNRQEFSHASNGFIHKGKCENIDEFPWAGLAYVSDLVIQEYFKKDTN